MKVLLIDGLIVQERARHCIPGYRIPLRLGESSVYTDGIQSPMELLRNTPLTPAVPTCNISPANERRHNDSDSSQLAAVSFTIVTCS